MMLRSYLQHYLNVTTYDTAIAEDVETHRETSSIKDFVFSKEEKVNVIKVEDKRIYPFDYNQA